MTDEGASTRPSPDPDPSTVSRRSLLYGGTAGALALIAPACSDETSTPDSSPPPPGNEEAGDTPGADLTLATTARDMEALAVTTYDTALRAMDEGRLGEVPPALSALVTTIRTHHVAQRQAWDELVADAEPAPPSQSLDPMEQRFAQQAAEVADSPGLARLARDLEIAIADTYVTVIPSLSAGPVLSLASSIQPVDSQHAAIARFLLGEYPVPETFSTGAQAFGGTGE